MATYFADDVDQLSFGVQASNVAEVAQFSSTLDNVVVRMFTNNGVETPDNLTTGVAIGSSNYDKTGTASNNLYFGHITERSNITPVFLMQDSKIAINSVPYSSNSLTIDGGMAADNISTPWIVASNVNDTFYNISRFKYINSATVSTGTISPSGLVPFAVNFNGNSTSYSYVLSATSNNTSIVSSTQTANANTTSYSSTFASGTYNVHLRVTTPGTGTGSSFIGSNLATFTVPLTDNIAAPSVALGTSPTFSSANIVNVSGIPYYGNGTTVTFGANGLGFQRMYNTIDPRTISGLNPLTINGSTYTYASVFTNVTAASTSNNNSLVTTLSSATNGLINLSSITRNVNFQSGITANIVSGIAYIGTAVNESTLDMATYTNMPITAATRLTIDAGESTPLTPAIGNLKDFTTGNGAPSPYDAFYAPINGVFYPSYASINRGTYAPSLPGGLSTTAEYLTFKLTTTAPLSTFVINFANSASINDVQIYWVSLGAWYSAKTFFTSGGCGSTTYTAGAIRFPITLPQGETLSGSTNIYVNVNFTGSINLAGIAVTYA
jgi:hypothetical protein